MVRLGLVAALITLCGEAYAFESARPMGLYVANHGPSLAMVESRIDVTVRGPIVETVVVQRFRNGSDRATEASYIFPLPAGAAVSAMAIRVGARTIHAAIESRDAALRRYEAAVAAGVAAALLDQERPDVFTQTVSAIPAKGVVEVTLRYDTLARYEAGTWELVVPMVVAPRYVPGTASGRATTGSGRAPDTDRAPDASRVTPASTPGAGGSTAVAIHFVDEPSELASPTHELGGTRSDATLSDPRSDHDAIVRWRAPAPSAGWVERDGDGGFAAVVVEAPPPAPRKTHVRVVLALDRAATTRGDADAVERPVLRALLGSLDRADRVRVIGSDTIAWNAPADTLAALERSWGTPVGVFDLTRVLEAARPDGAPIVLISDGLVADDVAAIAAAKRLGVPVHVIGIGPAPARGALQQIAAATGGTLRYAVAGDDLTALARGTLADVARAPPPLTVNWGALAASEIEPAVLPRLGAGQAMLVLARVKRVHAANARARGEVFAIEALAPARAVTGATTARGPLARCWARERLATLLAGKHDRSAITSLALSYGLVSPYTSLIAVGSEVIVQGGVKHSVAVPVSLPAGMQWQVVKQAIDTSGAAPPEPAPVSDAKKRARAPVATTLPTQPPVATTPSARPPVATRPPTKAPVAGAPVAQPPVAPSPAGAPVARPSPVAPTPAGAPVARPSPGEPSAEATVVTGSAPTLDSAKPPANTPDGGGAAPKEVSTAGSAAESEEDTRVLAETSARGEQLVVSGAARRRARLTASLGGGLAFDRSARGLLALNLRLETDRRTALGGEASLWLVGAEPEGRALLTIARRGIARRFEVGLGAGLHVGDGTGVASALRVRVDTPLRLLAGYLRYDAALLWTRPSLAAEHAITLGLELSY